MAFDFPASPTDGTVFSPAGGPTYIFSGGVWKISGGGGAFVVVADAAPPSPYPGMLWFESDSGALFFWYVDANSSQWVQINFTPSGARTAETRNRIVNPCFQISQEYDYAPVPGGGFAADQWSSLSNIPAAILARDSDLLNPSGSFNTIYIQIVTAKPSQAAGDLCAVQQAIEGIRVADFRWGTPLAKQAILRFTFWTDVAGTYSISLIDGASSVSYIDTFTISAAQASTYQTRSFVIPGTATGGWPTDKTRNMYLTITVAAGSTYTTATKGWQSGIKYGHSSGTNGAATVAYFYLYDVGLYLDPDATGIAPKWTMPDEAQELAACQRYWQKTLSVFSGNVTSAAGYNSSGKVINMRTAPGLTGVNDYANVFPATVGTLVFVAPDWVTDTRAANGSGPAHYRTIVTCNARM